MAFEDRCSPNQANSPGPVPNKVPSTDSNPNPNDRSLKPYTCSIIPYKYDRPKSPIMYRKSHVTPTIPNPLEAYRDNQSLFYHPYYNGFIINGMHRPYDYPLSVYDPFPKDVLPRNEIPQENAIDEDSANLNFSISNILRPEFGLNAIKKTTNKKEGPKSGGPTQSILYKPYELAKSASDSKISRKIDEPISPTAEMSFKFAPLGKLSHTVASLPQMIKPQIFKDNSMHGGISSKEDFGFSANKVDLLHRRPDSANSSISTASSTVSSQGMTQGGTGGYATGSDDGGSSKTSGGDKGNQQWPAWVYCTRYSDRPSSGPRSRRAKKQKAVPSPVAPIAEDKRPRTAFSGSQLARLKREFAENRYLTEKRRQHLSAELGLNEAQIKIWFQNKRAKIKKASGQKNPLALQLMAQGLYNHTTASGSEDEDEIKVT